MSIFRSPSNPQLKHIHTALDVLNSKEDLASGVRGSALVVEDVRAFCVFVKEVKTPTKLSELLKNGDVIIINDGRGLW